MQLRRTLVAAAVGLLLVPAAAHAYLDPGSGSMLLQALLGGAAGLAVLVRLFWRRLIAYLPSRREPAPTDDERG